VTAKKTQRGKIKEPVAGLDGSKEFRVEKFTARNDRRLSKIYGGPIVKFGH